MRKAVPLAVLCVFAAFQTFQFWDESHDAFDALGDNIQKISQKHLSFAPAAADDDPDASLPLVVGQSLGHERVLSSDDLSRYRPLPVPASPILAFIAIIPAQDRSPPAARPEELPPSRFVLRAAGPSTRILAPPLS